MVYVLNVCNGLCFGAVRVPLFVLESSQFLVAIILTSGYGIAHGWRQFRPLRSLVPIPRPRYFGVNYLLERKIYRPCVAVGLLRL